MCHIRFYSLQSGSKYECLPKIAGKLKIFSLGRKNSILKTRVSEKTSTIETYLLLIYSGYKRARGVIWNKNFADFDSMHGRKSVLQGALILNTNFCKLPETLNVTRSAYPRKNENNASIF